MAHISRQNQAKSGKSISQLRHTSSEPVDPTHERLAFLAQASRVLASSLDERSTLQEIACLAVPKFADYCTMFLLAKDGSINVAAICHRDPDMTRYLDRFERFRLYPSPGHPMFQAFRQKKTLLVRDVPPEFHRSAATNSEHGEALRLLDPVSYLAVPLMVRNKIVGGLAMVMTSDSERRFTDLDVQLGDDLGQRCAYAIESARLFREVQHAVRERDAFLAVASHELRTPVTSIKAIAELLIRQIESKKALSPEKLDRIAKFLNEQSDRLVRLVNQLLDVTQIDLGALKLVLKDTDITALVRNIVDVASLKHPNITFNLNAPASIQATVDPIRLEQVIVNLIDNAIRHSPESRRVEIEVLAVDEGKKFRISVRDFGRGIPEAQREQLFERFDRATRAEYSSGLGLGLYLCKQIMNMHRGQIWAEFPVDGGTKFVIDAPSKRPMPA